MPIGCPTAASTSCCADWRNSGSSASGPRAKASSATASRASNRSRKRQSGVTAATSRRAAAAREAARAQAAEAATDDFIPKDVPDADLVHAIAQHLEPLEKQALLECNSLLERCEVAGGTAGNADDAAGEIADALVGLAGLAGGGPTYADRRSAPIASVTKKIRLAASTTAPPVGTSRRVEINSPPRPATNATTHSTPGTIACPPRCFVRPPRAR